MYQHVPDIILDIEACKPGPEKVQWQRHSYVKVNYALRVKALRCHRTDSMFAAGSGRATRAMNPCREHEPLEHYHFTTLRAFKFFNNFTLN